MSGLDQADRLSARWSRVWRSMLDQSLQTILVWGHGVPGSYGSLTFLTGRVPSPKGELVVLTVGRRPCIVFPSAADAAAASVEGVPFATMYATSGESVVSAAVRLLGAERPVGSVGYATSDGLGLPRTCWMELTDLLGFEPTDYSVSLELARCQKTRADVDAMRRAVAVGETCLEQFRQRFRPGMTEREGAGLLAQSLVSEGGSLSMLFVSCGTFSGAVPGTRRLAVGEVVSATVEFAAPDGSWVELGALFCAGEPSTADARMCQDLFEVQRLAESMVRVGHTFGGTADRILSEIGRRGWAPVDGLGHGTGIDEEAVALAPGAGQAFAERSLVALHPSLRRPDRPSSVSVANVVAARCSVGQPLSEYPHSLHRLDAVHQR